MRENSSFRDNSGHIFIHNNLVFRQVNNVYKQHYDHLITSGLYQKLVSQSLMVTHEEQLINEFRLDDDTYKILKPQQIPFISYPYSWSFSMLKDAALLTLKIQKIAIAYGMTLKDATSFNVQFIGSKPIFIDTLSFEIYESGSPWKAYSQFCQHFLAPLALMAHTDISLIKLFVNYIDGIPLELATKLLPLSSRLNISLNIHLFLHAKLNNKYNDKKVKTNNNRFTNTYLKNLTENLSDLISSLKWNPTGTEWAEYYDKSVSKSYFEEKQKIIREFLAKIAPNTILDLGANDGTFSQIAAEYASNVLSFDIDPACVENNYLKLRSSNNLSILPLIVDVTNPEPGIGWKNQERTSLLERIKVDTVMALALIHHLYFSHNLPFSLISDFFVALTKKNLIIEFVPKQDEKVQKLLQNREDIFPEYNIDMFVKVFSKHFSIIEQRKVLPTNRIIFLLEKLCV